MFLIAEIFIALVILTAIRKFIAILFSKETKAVLYRKIRNIPVAGKIIIICWRFVKKIALCLYGIGKRFVLALWDTVIWVTKLPVVKQVIAIPVMLFKKLAGLWQRLLAWSKVD